MTRVLLVSPDRIAPAMAGPGIRYLELARALGATYETTVAAPTGSEPLPDAPAPATYDPERAGGLRDLVGAADVVVAPPLAPWLLGRPRPLRWIVDLYNPEPFEGLELDRRDASLGGSVRELARTDRMLFAIRSGSAFVCASDRQRDFWLGYLAAERRLAPHVYASDPELRELIDVVPSGVPDEPPRAGDRRFPGGAKVMAWNGGLWDWLDPFTPLRALVELRRDDPSWMLAFSGTGRPSHRAPMETAARVEETAAELGLTEADAVSMAAEWTPYAERGAVLLEATLGVSAHRASLESRYAFRTRMLDFLWARLPILCTDGDEWAAAVRAEGLGEVVPPEDPSALAAAARRIAKRGRDAYEDALAAAAARRSWSTVADPLARLVERVAGQPPRRPGLVAGALGLRHRAVATAARAARRRS